MYGKIETKGDYSVKLIASHEATDFLNVLYIRHLFTFLAIVLHLIGQLCFTYYTPTNIVFWGEYNYRNHPFASSCPFNVLLSCKHNFSLTDQLTLLKLYPVAVYSLNMCMGDNPSSNYIKGDNE